jgi:hypothetical protein
MISWFMCYNHFENNFNEEKQEHPTVATLRDAQPVTNKQFQVQNHLLLQQNSQISPHQSHVRMD